MILLFPLHILIKSVNRIEIFCGKTVTTRILKEKHCWYIVFLPLETLSGRLNARLDWPASDKRISRERDRAERGRGCNKREIVTVKESASNDSEPLKARGAYGNALSPNRANHMEGL